MAATIISCPNCAWDDKIDDSLLGRKVKCSKCGASFVAETGESYDLAGPDGKAPRSAQRRVPIPPKGDPADPPAEEEGRGGDDAEWKSWLEAWPEE